MVTAVREHVRVTRKSWPHRGLRLVTTNAFQRPCSLLTAQDDTRPRFPDAQQEEEKSPAPKKDKAKASSKKAEVANGKKAGKSSSEDSDDSSDEESEEESDEKPEVLMGTSTTGNEREISTLLFFFFSCHFRSRMVNTCDSCLVVVVITRK